MTDSSTAVRTSDLHAGDILLYHGDGWVSRAIRFFDGTDVSHAGLKVKDNLVEEALARGVVEDTLAQSVQGSAYVLVRRLKDPLSDADVAQLLAVAKGYVGALYAYHEILLLAFLCTVRKLKVTPILGIFLEGIFSQAADLIADLLSHGKKPLICSELVYRAYEKALPGKLVISRPMRMGAEAVASTIHPESLLAQIGPGPSMGANPASEVAGGGDLETLFDRYFAECTSQIGPEEVQALTFPSVPVVAQFRRYLSALQDSLPVQSVGAEDARNQLFQVAADFVTPGDLWRCESLMTVGRLA